MTYDLRMLGLTIIGLKTYTGSNAYEGVSVQTCDMFGCIHVCVWTVSEFLSSGMFHLALLISGYWITEEDNKLLSDLWKELNFINQIRTQKVIKTI